MQYSSEMFHGKSRLSRFLWTFTERIKIIGIILDEMGKVTCSFYQVKIILFDNFSN